MSYGFISFNLILYSIVVSSKKILDEGVEILKFKKKLIIKNNKKTIRRNNTF